MDSIINVYLKNTYNYIVYPLSLLFEESMIENYDTLIWKIAHITPTYKKGPNYCAFDYRSKSITLTILKVMERITVNQFHEYLAEQNILTLAQF